MQEMFLMRATDMEIEALKSRQEGDIERTNERAHWHRIWLHR